jgi:hypothetical protein
MNQQQPLSDLTILIIRHAEKPFRDWPGPGLTDAGNQDDKSLVIRGWQRAGAWTALFGASLSGPDYPSPSTIYAADPTAAPNDEHDDEPSQRPSETVSALGKRLGVTPITRFAVGQEKSLAAEVLLQSGVVLIAWEHKAITRELLPAIFKDKNVSGSRPGKWDGARFDVVLRLDRKSSGTDWVFRQLCPCLLSGDSPNPMQ